MPDPTPITPVVTPIPVPQPASTARLDALDRARLTSHITSLVEAALEMADKPEDALARQRFDDARKWLDRTVDALCGVIV